MARPSNQGKPAAHRLGRVFGVKRKSMPGAPPGTIVVDKEAPPSLIRVIGYDAQRIAEGRVDRPAELAAWLDRWSVLWINVDGLGNAKLLEELAELVSMHRLILEDVVNVHQRPKVEDYDGHLFIVTRMVTARPLGTTEQVTLFLAPRLLVTFQETIGDCLDPVRQRIRDGKGRIRTQGPDYLAYAVLDAITDAYFPYLEARGEKLEQIEEEALRSVSRGTVRRIHEVRRELLLIRRAVWPMREMFSGLLRESSPMISESTKPYLRDCYDHSVQLMDVLENYREIESSLMEIYLSTVNLRMNEVMKVLTVISTIFIPLTFLAGLYGMNFQHMPELNTTWGYPACLAVMAITAGGLLFYFYKRGWIGRNREEGNAESS